MLKVRIAETSKWKLPRIQPLASDLARVPLLREGFGTQAKHSVSPPTLNSPSFNTPDPAYGPSLEYLSILPVFIIITFYLLTNA